MLVLQKKDLQRVEEFLDESNLVKIMSDFGLEFNQMAFILQSIANGIHKVHVMLEGEENE